MQGPQDTVPGTLRLQGHTGGTEDRHTTQRGHKRELQIRGVTGSTGNNCILGHQGTAGTFIETPVV